MRLSAVAIVLSVLLAAPAAQAAESITKYEIRRAPAARVEREVLRQLSDIIKLNEPEVRPLTDERPVMPLTDMWFDTEPRNTEAPGLCRYDTLVMEFEPTGEPGTGADTRVHASGFTAHSQYAVIVPPAGVFDAIVYAEQPPPRGPSCRGLSKDVFFAAPDAETAFDGVYFAAQAFKALDDKVLPYSLECYSSGDDKCLGELKKLRDLRPDQWGWLAEVDRCSMPDGVYGRCFELTIDEQSVRLTVIDGKVSRVRHAAMLILSHTRRD